ncbi:hypothetical protein DFQ11_1133 [Winogradskyella epiphytica]|jgi:hypothetical protein|uniref:Uncharacterized protein n=1 Tax=Winogradskyella epiphytica TaxID=262005 RepID=A0A2V4YA24_9FLAO|nr:hypothetical protein [Winogradskyella epiphytica]PYE79009.1 hypothetical protein DFQ11_1133 [Winogradskyella epiphytica]GGW74605.1 hypothetical protein GCM10008085_28380 [Winogradskyella epiphytica]
MEEAYEILNYLPIRFKNQTEQEYIEFLWDSFESNYNNEKYQFSFMAYHMLFMSFVYFNVWQIKKIHQEDYKKITLGFNDCFGSASSPFAFSAEGESRIFLLFTFFGLGKEKIGNYKKLVKRRNDVAHSNGNIFFKAQETVDEKITEILKFADEIQEKTKSAIQDGFEKFLIDSQDEEERRYIDIQEQINEELIHEHYMSRKDIEFCLDYDITQLSEQPNYAEIEKIFEELKTEYAQEEANA